MNNLIKITALVMALMISLLCVSAAFAEEGFITRYSKYLLRRGCGDPDGASPELNTYVKRLQKDINKTSKGDCGAADGIFGRQTKKGVKSYQLKMKLKDDGIAGDKTKKTLFNDKSRF